MAAKWFNSLDTNSTFPYTKIILKFKILQISNVYVVYVNSQKICNVLFSDKLELISNHAGRNFHYCRYRYICDGTNEAPDVPAQANPEQESPIEPNLEQATFQPHSSLKNQLQSNAVKTNLTKLNPSFGRPESLQDFYIPNG